MLSFGMNWQEVCDSPQLRDLPFKIELNRFGQIVMSPASNEHGRLQTRIAARLLDMMSGGEVITECSINTSDGTKVADVAWGSTTFFATRGLVTPLPAAPEICVEIVSPSNSDAQMDAKAQLYFEAGASEVWLCDSLGNLAFKTPAGARDSSAVAPSFPKHV